MDYIEEKISLAKKIESLEPHDYFYNMFSRYTSKTNLKQLKKYWNKYLDFYHNNQKNISLDMYIHVPFCKRKCAYCQYFSISNFTEKTKESYVEYLLDYIDYFSEVFKNFKFKNLYIGGGSPNSLSVAQIQKLLTKLFSKFNFEDGYERTIEFQPSLFSEDFLDVVKEFGFNRISLGVQSFNQNTLDNLNREHVSETSIKKICSSIKDKGIQQLNIDLIVGLKGETEDIILDSINKSLTLGADTITMYTIQENIEQSNFFDTTRSFYEHISSFFANIKSMEFGNYNFKEMDDSLTIGCSLLSKKLTNFSGRYEQSSLNAKSLFAIGSGSKGHIYGLLEYLNDTNLYDSFSELNIVNAQKFNWNSLMGNFIVKSFYDDKISKLDFKNKFKKEISTIFSEEISYLNNLGFIHEDKDFIHLNFPDTFSKIVYSAVFIPLEYLKKLHSYQKKLDFNK